MAEYNPDLQGDIRTDGFQEPCEPFLYRVMLHNDDYTTMDFVVRILTDVFHKNHEEAIQIMLRIHNDGVGMCGIYPHDIAQTKVSTVTRLATEHEFPLKSTLEQV